MAVATEEWQKDGKHATAHKRIILKLLELRIEMLNNEQSATQNGMVTKRAFE